MVSPGGFETFERLFVLGYLYVAGASMAALLVVAPGQSLVRPNDALLVDPTIVSFDRPWVWALVLGVYAAYTLGVGIAYEIRNGQCMGYYCPTRDTGVKSSVLTERQYNIGLSTRFALVFGLGNFFTVLAAAIVNGPTFDLRIGLLVLVSNTICQSLLYFIQSKVYDAYRVKQL